MHYILNKNIGLRSWHKVPYAYYMKGDKYAQGLSEKEFNALRKCDGVSDVEENPILSELERQGFIKQCKKGEFSLDKWQYKQCDNRYFASVNWMITGKCNYNCLHCFNAADNAPLMSEFSLEEANKFLDECQKCGINSFTITGGEPMLHKNFLEIMQGIVKRGMFVEELNTNGHFINDKILVKLKEIGCDPMMKISLDGLGYHDWMRNKPGAEKTAIRAIELCIKHGFCTMAQINVNKKNADSMLKTIEFLDEIGVANSRIIRTTEAPRWLENCGDSTLGLIEYYDLMLDLATEYIKKPHRMNLDMWQFLNTNPRSKRYHIRTMTCEPSEYRDSLPVCRGNRGMVAVGANGNVYPCHQMSGYYENKKILLGNVKKDGLQRLLTSGDYLDEVCMTVKELTDNNSECRECEHYKLCLGGCRAIALALTFNKYGIDPSKCAFYKNGYHNKIVQQMQGYKSTMKF